MITWGPIHTEELIDHRFGVDYEERQLYYLRDEMLMSANARQITIMRAEGEFWRTLYDQELSEDDADGWPTPAMQAISKILSDLQTFLVEQLL